MQHLIEEMRRGPGRRPGDLQQIAPAVPQVTNPETSPIGNPANPDEALPIVPPMNCPSLTIIEQMFNPGDQQVVASILESNPFGSYTPEIDKPAEWIMGDTPIYDGDLVSFKSPAYGGTVLQSFGESVIGNTSVPNPTRAMGPTNIFSFMIRRVKLDSTTGIFSLENPELVNPKSIGYGTLNLFMLISTSEPNKVVRTRTVDQTAFATVNSNLPVILGDFPFMTREGYDKCRAGTLGTAKTDCINKYTQSVAIWYFEREKLSGLNAAQTPAYGRSVLIRNYFAELIDRPLYHGGRNLTIAGGSGGHNIKTSGRNNDSDDKSIWQINTWGGVPTWSAPLPRYGPRAQALEAFGGPIQERIDALTERQKCILKQEMEKKFKGKGNWTYNSATGKWSYDDNESKSIRDQSVLEAVHDLEKALMEQKDPRALWERLFQKLTGKPWSELNFIERQAIGLLVLGSLGFLTIYSAERLIDKLLK